MVAKTEWFIFAVDGDSEERIGAELAEMQIAAECFKRGVLCIDEKTRDMWMVDYSVITKIKKYRSSAHLKFRVYKRDTPGSPVREWKFLDPKKKTLDDARKSGDVRKGVQQEPA